MKSLGVPEIRSVGVLGHDGHRAEDTDRLGFILIQLRRARERGIEAGDRRADAERRTDKATCASAGAACGYGGAAGAGAHAAAESADTAAGSVLHDTGI